MKNTNKKGIVYCRVSSQEQIQGTSLEGQKQACLGYAEKEGIEITKIFIEKGESATAADRTELIKALEYCRLNQGSVGAFIVWKIDRFARNTTDHFALKAQLGKYNISLMSVTELISDDPMGRMMETMLAGYAQLENDVRKQRCEGGMQRKIEQGIWPWQPPIGYIHAKKLTDRRKTQPDTPDPERFYLIQKALRAYLTGNFTITGLAGLMNQWGFKTRTNKPIGKQLLEKLLKEKFYAGILFDPWTNKEYKGLHTPMISVEEYNHIQEIKSGFSRHTDRPRQLFHPELPLRRFVSCECGSKLTGSLHRGSNSDKKYPIYHCHNRNCQHFGHTIRKEDLEKVFVDLLYRITPKTELLNLFEAVVVSSWESQHVAVKQERKHYDQELSKLQTQKDNLLQMRVRGEISKEEFLIMKERIDNTITGIKISSNESQIEELNVEIIIDNAKKLIGNVAEQWKEMNPSQKHRFQKLVLPHGITYNKNSNALGTAVLSPVFKLNDEFAGSSSDLVAWVGQNWQGMIADLKDLSDLYMDKKEQLPL